MSEEAVFSFSCGAVNADATKWKPQLRQARIPLCADQEDYGFEHLARAIVAPLSAPFLRTPTIVGVCEVGAHAAVAPLADVCGEDYLYVEDTLRYHSDRSVVLWDANQYEARRAFDGGRITEASGFGGYQSVVLTCLQSRADLLVVNLHLPRRRAADGRRALAAHLERASADVDGVVILGDWNARAAVIRSDPHLGGVLSDYTSCFDGREGIENVFLSEALSHSVAFAHKTAFTHAALGAAVQGRDIDGTIGLRSVSSEFFS